MIILAPLLLLQTVQSQPGTALATAERPPNVLILLADDLGVDQVAAYGEGANPPWMPNVDALAQDGVLFRNAYGNPYCSPTRAALLTGRHAFRTGIGTYMTKPDLTGFALQPSEITLPEMVQMGPRSYATAAIGICKRQGLGRVRHLATADLWLQQRVKARELLLSKVPGKDNPADVFT